MLPFRREILKRLAKLDEQFQEFGISDEYKKRWGVETNVGLWSIAPEVGRYLHELILKKKPQVIVEIGTSLGYSTIWIGAAAEQYYGMVYSLEKADYKYREADDNIKEARLEDTVSLIQGDAEHILKDWHGEIDLLFLDGNKKGYLPQLKLAEPFMKPGSMVIADNVIDMADRLTDFLEYMKTHPDYEVRILDSMRDGLLVATRK
jgi:predicted O-methyltransferase YrrM